MRLNSLLASQLIAWPALALAYIFLTCQRLSIYIHLLSLKTNDNRCGVMKTAVLLQIKRNVQYGGKDSRITVSPFQSV